MATDKIDFEATMSRLETLVAQMESGELTLEQSVAVFEEGVTLTQQAQIALQAAEQTVKVLLEQRGELRTAPLNEVADSDTP